ncbi:TetR/AcrR family transcriptional regulator [Rufibacter sediminis]|uniref:TetR/AcrR family transcriptional regulator n=1 Tax=Rufibacter sediminis TaxID=2762756 RepID=A0ABR6VTM9_9BACT|nr:TetR/AcrR family transcriptional regulator [Rufibacter sediminis]MBC3540188.1 TetR/AcrR family transcriptional regulator [Rufibacter sediminis]
MNRLPTNIKIKVEENVYLKDPESSEKGKLIIEHGIKLMEELGLEAFTFKKLAERTGTTEATIYRYFESKHNLLVYLISWYWSWLEYRLVFATSNIASPEERLRVAIRILSGRIENDMDFAHIEEVTLQKIVIAESAKVYLTKAVDEDNKEGFFLSYKRLNKRIVDIILEINPAYAYPASLVSTVSESAHYQVFYAKHLPSLTNIDLHQENQLVDFLTEMVLRTIQK